MDDHTECGGHLAVSIVVPTRDGGPLAATIARRALPDPATAEVVVVLDRAGAPGPQLAALAASDERVRVVPGSGRGPAAARATGARAARGDVVLFLDDDVLPGPLLATGHARAHERHANAVVVGSMPVAPDACRREATARVYASDYARVVDRYGDSQAVLADLWAGNVSMRREDYLAVGMTADASVRAHHEDRELGLRCRAAGLTGVYDETLRAEHRYSRSVPAFLRLAREQVRAARSLHALHADELGPWEPDVYVRGLAPRVAMLVDTITRVGLTRPALVSLRLAGHVALVVRARRWEDRTVWFARALVQHREARAPASAHDERRDPGDHHHEAEHDVDERAGDGRLGEITGLPV